MTIIFNKLFEGYTQVGEHVARGVAVLLLLPKEKHRRGKTSEVTVMTLQDLNDFNEFAHVLLC